MRQVKTVAQVQEHAILRYFVALECRSRSRARSCCAQLEKVSWIGLVGAGGVSFELPYHNQVLSYWIMIRYSILRLYLHRTIRRLILISLCVEERNHGIIILRRNKIIVLLIITYVRYLILCHKRLAKNTENSLSRCRRGS